MTFILAAWFTLAPLLTPRQEISVAEVNGKVYAVGGISGQVILSSVEEYDPVTNRWRFVAPLPAPVHHAAAASVDGRLYVIGGYRTDRFEATRDVFRYDPALDQWTFVASLPRAAGALAAAVIDGKIYAVGGAPTLRDLVVYDPAADVWSTLPQMPSPREHLAAASFEGKLYVAGGRAGGNTDAFESYDPVTNAWTVLPDVPTARSGIAAAVLNGRMYVFGGEGNPVSITGTFPHTESYDFATGTWRREENMPTPRHGIGAATVSGIIHVPGGAPVQGFGITDVHEAFGVFPRRRIVVSP